MSETRWKKGDTLLISKRHSEPGKGLSYFGGLVSAKEDGVSGGWDVFDGERYGKEISFYGFSVKAVVRS
jgi:hypothetical protein